MTVIDVVHWLRKHYAGDIETYPVQKDFTTYYYIPLHRAKEIVKAESVMTMIDRPLKEIDDAKTLFSGIDDKEHAKIDLFQFARILKDYL